MAKKANMDESTTNQKRASGGMAQVRYPGKNNVPLPGRESGGLSSTTKKNFEVQHAVKGRG